MGKKFKVTVPAFVYATFFINAEDEEDAEDILHSLDWRLSEGVNSSIHLSCYDVKANLTTNGELNFEDTDIIEV